MFHNLQETIKALNADVNNVANCEKAKKLRKRLLSVGLPMAIIGFVGVIVCFILFATAGFDAFGDKGFTPRVLVPFILFLPCMAIGSIGAVISSFGFRIIITGYAANLINETVGDRCPECGETVNLKMSFCPKCGAKLKKVCSVCGRENELKNDYCEKCGNKLDD